MKCRSLSLKKTSYPAFNQFPMSVGFLRFTRAIIIIMIIIIMDNFCIALGLLFIRNELAALYTFTLS